MIFLGRYANKNGLQKGWEEWKKSISRTNAIRCRSVTRYRYPISVPATAPRCVDDSLTRRVNNNAREPWNRNGARQRVYKTDYSVTLWYYITIACPSSSPSPTRPRDPLSFRLFLVAPPCVYIVIAGITLTGAPSRASTVRTRRFRYRWVWAGRARVPLDESGRTTSYRLTENRVTRMANAAELREAFFLSPFFF